MKQEMIRRAKRAIRGAALSAEIVYKENIGAPSPQRGNDPRSEAASDAARKHANDMDEHNLKLAKLLRYKYRTEATEMSRGKDNKQLQALITNLDKQILHSHPADNDPSRRERMLVEELKKILHRRLHGPVQKYTAREQEEAEQTRLAAKEERDRRADQAMAEVRGSLPWRTAAGVEVVSPSEVHAADFTLTPKKPGEPNTLKVKIFNQDPGSVNMHHDKPAFFSLRDPQIESQFMSWLRTKTEGAPQEKDLGINIANFAAFILQMKGDRYYFPSLNVVPDITKQNEELRSHRRIEQWNRDRGRGSTVPLPPEPYPELSKGYGEIRSALSTYDAVLTLGAIVNRVITAVDHNGSPTGEMHAAGLAGFSRERAVLGASHAHLDGINIVETIPYSSREPFMLDNAHMDSDTPYHVHTGAEANGIPELLKALGSFAIIAYKKEK